MSRRLLNLLTALSLLLCVAAAAAWASSYCRGVFSSDGRVLVLGADHEALSPFLWSHQREVNAGLWYELAGRGPASLRWQWAGFQFNRGEYYLRPQQGRGARVKFWLVAVPYWALVLAGAAASAALSAAALRARRRARTGLCARCGYDLTGNISGVCPECGVAM